MYCMNINMGKNIKFRVPKFMKSVKYLLAAVNGVFLLTGLLILLVGIIVLLRFTEYESLITKRFFNLSGFAVATGVIIILGTGLGVYAAISQEFYFVAGYVVLLLVILVFEMSIVIVSFALSNEAESEIRSSMAQSIQLYGVRRDIAKTWDDLQMGFQCCGIAGRFDWVSNQIPISCCHIDYGTISPFVCATANAYTVGCATALGEYLAQQAYVIAMSTLVANCLLVILILISCYLAWRAKFEEVELES